MAGQVSAGFIKKTAQATGSSALAAITWGGASDSDGWINVSSVLYASLFLDYGGTSVEITTQGRVDGGPTVEITAATAYTADGFVQEKLDVAKYSEIRFLEETTAGTNKFHLICK